MISDLYHSLRKDSTINKLTGKGFLIVEYKCPVETEHFQLMSEQNIVMYIMSGKKDWTIKGVTFQAKEGDAFFLRKGVYATVQYFEAEHCVLLFFLSDDFIMNFMMENEL